MACTSFLPVGPVTDYEEASHAQRNASVKTFLPNVDHVQTEQILTN
jgi:hypothetical protein